MKLDMVILVSIGVIALVGLIVFIVIRSREKFVPASNGALYLGSYPPGNPGFYNQLGPYYGCDASPVKVTPNMMQLPEPSFGPGFYANVLNLAYDPISGIPVQMYSSPRVPLSDFQSELNRCGCCESANCQSCKK